MTTRTRMETAHLLCDSDNFEDVISTLKKEGEELELELNEVKAELAELWSRFDRQMKAEAEVERLRGIVQAQLDELEAIDCALGTSEGHSAVDHIVPLRAEVERLKDRLNDCLSFVALHGQVGATPDTAKLLEVRIRATLNPAD